MLIWVVTNEGVGETIYESQVLGQYLVIRSLKHESRVISYHTWWNGFRNSLKRKKIINNEYGVNIISTFWSPFYYLPFSNIYPSLHFFFFFLFATRKPKVIHCRTEYSVVIVALVKLFYNIKIVFDCRGDTVAEFTEYFKPKNVILKLFKTYTLQAMKSRLYIALRLSNVHLFVSEKLKSKISISDSDGFVVPCLPIDNIFYFDNRVREANRSNLGFDNKRVILYSGALTGYQNFESVVNVILPLLDSTTIFWVVTNEYKKAENILKNILGNCFYKVSNFAFNDMNIVYNVADVGVLIRDANNTNLVASPTKFFEYCFAGLRVLHNHSVSQVSSVTKIIGNDISFEDLKLNKIEEIDRGKISEVAIKIFRKSNYNKVYTVSYEG